MIAPQHAMQIIRANQISPPVDVIAVAQAFGLNVFADHLPLGVSGQIVRRPEYGSASGYSIIVNSGEAMVRQRFTVAHEIAHFVLHKDMIGDGIQESTLYRAAGFSSRQEVEANKLAADILMPWHLLTPLLSAEPRTTSDLAQEFVVSEVAMSIRLGLPT